MPKLFHLQVMKSQSKFKKTYQFAFLETSQECVPSRNAFLGDLQEHAPELAFGPFSGTVPECQVLQGDMK